MNFCKAVRILTQPGHAIKRASWNEIDVISFIENDGEFRYVYGGEGIFYSSIVNIAKDGSVSMNGTESLTAWTNAKDWIELTRAEYLSLREEFDEAYGNPD